MSSSSAVPSSRHNAHLAMSLKVKGQRRLNFRRRGTGRTLSALLGCADHCVEPNIGGLNDPRPAFAGLPGRKNVFGNQATNGRGTDRKGLGRLVKRRLATFSPFSLAIDGDGVIVAQRGNARSCPRIPLPRRLSRAVQSGCDRHVRHLPGHCPHQLHNIDVHAPAMLSRTVLAYA